MGVCLLLSLSIHLFRSWATVLKITSQFSDILVFLSFYLGNRQKCLIWGDDLQVPSNQYRKRSSLEFTSAPRGSPTTFSVCSVCSNWASNWHSSMKHLKLQAINPRQRMWNFKQNSILLIPIVMWSSHRKVKILGVIGIMPCLCC